MHYTMWETLSGVWIWLESQTEHFQWHFLVAKVGYAMSKLFAQWKSHPENASDILCQILCDIANDFQSQQNKCSAVQWNTFTCIYALHTLTVQIWEQQQQKKWYQKMDKTHVHVFCDVEFSSWYKWHWYMCLFTSNHYEDENENENDGDDVVAVSLVPAHLMI